MQRQQEHFIADWNRRNTQRIRVLKFILQRGQAYQFQVQEMLGREASPRSASAILYILKKCGIVNYSEWDKFYSIDRRFKERIEKNIEDIVLDTTTTTSGSSDVESEGRSVLRNEEKSITSSVHSHKRIIRESYINHTPVIVQSPNLHSNPYPIEFPQDPTLDPMKTGPPPPEINSSSVEYRWVPKSAPERVQITLAGWMERENPDYETREIIAYFMSIYMKSGSTLISFNDDSDLAVKFGLESTSNFRQAWARLTTDSRLLYIKPVRDRITGLQQAGIRREFLCILHHDWTEFNSEA